jgi:diketogulonate reductase-like aldo/keto reductase
MMSKNRVITLTNGTTIPQLGFGTLGVPPDRRPSKANTEKTAQVVGLALEVGYRHIEIPRCHLPPGL